MYIVLPIWPKRTSLHERSDLEESLEVVDLEDGVSDDDTDLEDGPPLDTVVGGLGGVSVGSLPDDDVALLVLDLADQVGQSADGTV